MQKMMKKYSEFERVFHNIDGNGDGKISATELQQCVGLIGGELSAEEAKAAVESLDSDGDGMLALEDFVGLMEGKGEEEKVEDLRVAFGMYVMDDESSCITPKSLKRMLSRLGESKTVDECLVMITQFDLNGDGVLCFDEFKAMML